jgi:FixJ family two-component response regulator
MPGQDHARVSEEAALSLSAAPTIVVVQDDLAMRSALAFALEVDGFRVMPFESVGSVESEGTDLRDVDCLVIDQSVGAESGLDLLERLRSRGLSGPAVILTSGSAKTVGPRARLLGAQMVEKPLIDNRLFGAIRTLLGRTASA